MKKFNWKEPEEFKQLNHFHKFLDLNTPLGLFTVSWNERVTPIKYGAAGIDIWLGWFDTLEDAKEAVIDRITEVKEGLIDFLYHD